MIDTCRVRGAGYFLFSDDKRGVSSPIPLHLTEASLVQPGHLQMSVCHLTFFFEGSTSVSSFCLLVRLAHNVKIQPHCFKSKFARR